MEPEHRTRLGVPAEASAPFPARPQPREQERKRQQEKLSGVVKSVHRRLRKKYREGNGGPAGSRCGGREGVVSAAPLRHLGLPGQPATPPRFPRAGEAAGPGPPLALHSRGVGGGGGGGGGGVLRPGGGRVWLVDC